MRIKGIAVIFGTIALLVICGIVVFNFYSYIFAKSVVGEISKVERVTQVDSIIATGMVAPNSQLFSYAIAIKDSKGEIHTSSSEDRQWSVAQTGQCVEAKFFPYPPWKLDKSGTYFGARLLKLSDCAQKTAQ